jgi:hypothetical protein
MRARRRSMGFLFTVISGGAHNRPPKSMECRVDSDPEARNTFLRSTPHPRVPGLFPARASMDALAFGGYLYGSMKPGVHASIAIPCNVHGRSGALPAKPDRMIERCCWAKAEAGCTEWEAFPGS